mgnify:CR=1 FL=1
MNYIIGVVFYIIGFYVGRATKKEEDNRNKHAPNDYFYPHS